MAKLNKIVRGSLSNVSQQTIAEDTFYEVQDMPIGGITNAQMVSALTQAQEGFYQVGSVYLCTDTVANQYTANTFYKFTGSAWEELQIGSVTKEDIIRNLPAFKSTIELSISDTSTAYTFPIVSSTNFAVDWGDGTFESFSTATTSLTHTFAASGTIYVQFYGEWNGIQYTSSDNSSKNLIRYVSYASRITSLPDYAFYNCRYLSNFKYEATTIDIGSYCFWQLYPGNGLLDIDLSRINTIGSYAFYGTRLFGIVVINASYAYSYAFSSTENIVEATITQRLGTSGGTEYYGAFRNCYTIRKITLIGKNNISSSAFGGNSRLKTIIIKPQYYNNNYYITSLRGSLGSNLPSDLVILVPYYQLSDYKTATNWTTYANQIYPIGGQYSETVTIASNAWTLNSQTNLYEATATVVGATNESRNILDWSLVDSNGNQIEDTYGLGASAQGSMSITFTAQTAPTDAIYISVQSTLTNYQE